MPCLDGSVRRSAGLLALVALLSTGGVARAQLQADPIYAGGFEAADIPATDAEAARFLTQASFGPTKADIAHLRSVGYGAWIDEQIALPATLAEPYLAALTPPSPGLQPRHRMDRWFNTAAVAPDQLRQRVAYSLSQIVVISDQSIGEPLDVADYWDLLVRDSFAPYRTLLQDVSLSPQMGRYLSHLRNQKADPARNVSPDENYAREVMQLFSIGLEFRNPDFSPILDGSNNPIPTYDQNVVVELAQVFTGFSYPCPNPPGGCNTYSGLFTGPASFSPMACFARYHDTSDKQLFARTPGGLAVVLPAGPTCPNSGATAGQMQACLDYCIADLKGALDALGGQLGVTPFDGHPNVAPFISRQLIQRLVSSNPSPAYIQRVATTFNTSGGDIGAVIRAILLDAEARDTPTDPNYGKPREPMLKLVAMWRAWNAQMQPDNASTGLPMGINQPDQSYLQRPLGAPSVFNFYEPDYQQPGPISAANLFSPELQIVNESSIATAGNNLYTFSWNSYLGMSSPPSNRPLLDLAQLTSLPNNAAMVDEANLRMLYGSMSLAMRDALIDLLDNNMSGSTATQRALALIHLIELSPEFATQR